MKLKPKKVVIRPYSTMYGGGGGGVGEEIAAVSSPHTHHVESKF